MHGNSEMQKINQTSAMPEKTDVHWSGRFSVAPMLDWTDRHCRYFLRLLSRNTLLYTEMVTTGAIIHGKGDYLAYSEEEHPVALQLGGSDPVAVVRAMYPYIERELSQGTYLGHITRHMLGLFQGIPGARQWRRYLSENAHKAGADINVLEHALKLVADKR